MDLQQLLGPAAATRVAAVPKLDAFVRQITTILSSGAERSFEQCLPHFADLVRGGALLDLVQHELSRMVSDPDYSSTDSRGTHITIARAASFTLAAMIVDGPVAEEPRRFPDFAEDRLVGAVGPGPLVLHRYHQPAPHPHDVIDRTRRLSDHGLQTLAPGACLFLRAAEDITEVVPSGEPAVLLTLMSAPVCSVAWEYDRETLSPTRMVVSDQVAFRIEHAAGTLAEIGDPSSIPVLVGFFEHPNHSVRWAAVRAVMRLDSEEGVRLLHRAVHDPHPYIQHAASGALEKLGEAPPWP